MDFGQNITVFTVSELTRSIKSSLELQFRFVHICGEVSNLRIPYSGHMYFTLKDNSSQIKAVLFKGQQKFLPGKIEEGQSIICHGRLSVYEPRGEYQIIVDTVDLSGRGDLHAEFEKLKRKLADEGLFSSAKKMVVPPFAENLLLITSPTGAAVRDFLKIASNRGYWGTISILPVVVQGQNAATEIARAIDTACTETQADIIVLLRGGGSLEDLWAFNEEKTARAIYRSTIPVVTGIGHETDTTISDLCADLATHTPTAAAEAIIADRFALTELFLTLRKNLTDRMKQYLTNSETQVHNLKRIMGNLDLYLANHSLKLDYLATSLTNAIEKNISSLNLQLDKLTDRLHRYAPLNSIRIQEQRLDYLQTDLRHTMSRVLHHKRNVLAQQAALLDSVSPLSILSRGYSIVSHAEGKSGEVKIISKYSQVKKGDKLHIKLHEGGLGCEVQEIKKGKQHQR